MLFQCIFHNFKQEKNDKTSDKETKEESKEDKTPPAKPTPQKKVIVMSDNTKGQATLIHLNRYNG